MPISCVPSHVTRGPSANRPWCCRSWTRPRRPASLGAFFHSAGGTILQLAAPVAAAVMFLRQPDWFAAAFCLGWLSTNLHGVGTYMADADAMRLRSHFDHRHRVDVDGTSVSSGQSGA